MEKIAVDPRRRRVIRLIATGAVVVPFGSTVPTGTAVTLEMVKESDPAAVALKYKADATKAPERKDPAALCENCNYYSGKPGSDNGACSALGDRLVAAKGWCESWEGY
jgi:hypothetical protein